MIRCTSLFIRLARLSPYDAAMMLQSGQMPKHHAGNRLDTSSLLPCLGGIVIIIRGDFPARASSMKRIRRAQISRCTHPASYPGFVASVNAIRLRRASSIVAAFIPMPPNRLPSLPPQSLFPFR